MYDPMSGSYDSFFHSGQFQPPPAHLSGPMTRPVPATEPLKTGQDTRHKFKHSFPANTSGFMEVVDPQYSSVRGNRVVSSDNVVFYLPTRLLAQIPQLYKIFSREQSTFGHALTHEYEDAASVRLVLELLQSRRLDGEDMTSWPPLLDLGRALVLAKKFGVMAVYKVLVNCIQAKLQWQNWGRQAFDVFQLAGRLGDDILARYAVEAMQRQSDVNLSEAIWSEEAVSSNEHLPSMLWCPGTWTADEFDSLPRAYIYSLCRATLPSAIPLNDSAKCFGTQPTSDRFAHYLRGYRKHEMKKRTCHKGVGSE